MSETVIKKSFCGICTGECPIDCAVKDGKLISVEASARPDGSVGGLCPKGAAAVQFEYNKERLLYPMRRVGEKGSGEFERISWEEAFHEISERLLGIREANGAESVLFYAGYPKWYRPALLRFANAFGSPNFCTESSTCFQAFALSWRLTFGNHPCFGDMRNCKTLLIWSRNPSLSGVTEAPALRALKERGAKIITVDPRTTVTAYESDIHLKLIPGTDGALALSMAQVIIGEGLCDDAFIREYVHGFEAFSEYVKDFTPERTEQITGVPAAQIREAARLYAQYKPSAVMFSAAPVVHNTNGVQNYRAVEALIAITGNYDIEGGNRTAPGPAAPLNEFGSVKRKNDVEAIGERDFPVWFDLPCEEAQCTRLADYIEQEEPYPLKALFAMGMNVHMWPKPSHLQRALAKLDFYVNVDLFYSDSCRYADILLPAQTFFERTELMGRPGPVLRMREPVVEPQGEAKNDIEIIQELMRRMGLSDPVLSGSYEEYLDYILKPSGVSAAELKGRPEGVKAVNLRMPGIKTYLERPFATPSGKIELYSEVLAKHAESHGYDPLPVWKDYREGFSKEEKERYPLTLSTGSRKPQFYHSRTYRMSWLKNLEPAAQLSMHPEDAAARGLSEGDSVEISSPVGAVRAVLHIDLSSRRGVVNMYHGNAEADANELISEHYLDPISGFPGFKSYICEVGRA
ncbi:MAG: molybdopterin-dependent oxidoreductase [Eubacteriales bacterium]|nr:molybdopterin-dependent oxidoreductase [Eubacteriales bacterium]